MKSSDERNCKDIYKPSRVIYITMAAFECMVQIIVSGSFLSKLTTTIGISDGVTAILSTVTSLSCSLQVISILLAHKTPVKRWVIPLQAVAEILLGALYLICVFFENKSRKKKYRAGKKDDRRKLDKPLVGQRK